MSLYGSTPLPTAERVACPDCALVQVLPPPKRGQVAECNRCGRVLAGATTCRIDVSLALSVAALLLFLPAACAPLMSVWSFGAERESRLYSGVGGLWRDGFPSLSVLVAAFGIVLPLVYLILVNYVLGGLHFGFAGPLGKTFRWVQRLRPWMMLDVFLMGCFVAYSRLNAIASVDIGMGGWCLIAATFVHLMGLTQIDDRTVWEGLPPGHANAADDATSAGHATTACKTCDLIVDRTRHPHRCPRCGAALNERIPYSIQTTTALVVAGFILYIPANLLPVLTIVHFGHEEHNTIMSGVAELIRNNLWPLAVIVFVASVVLPLMKLCGLTWMLLATSLRSSQLLVTRTRFYRMIDLIGRWSNIDVFMGSVLIAVLQFGALTSIHAGNGLVAFAGVVVITMFATLVFDARLMWDAAQRAG